MGDADAVGKGQILQDRPRLSGRGIVADQPAVAAALETVERPVGQFVARGGFAEIDLAVGRDVEVVGQTQPRIVLETSTRCDWSRR